MQRIVWYGLIIGLVILAVVPRVLQLDAFRAADEKIWISHTEYFTTKLATGDWGHLVSEAHPAITMQWLGMLAVRFDDWGIKKVPLVWGQIIILLFIWYVLYRLWGRAGGLMSMFFLIVDPLLYAHMRIYEMEALLALFFVLSLSLLLLWHKTRENRYLLLAGATAAAAVLSKMPGILLVPITGLFLVFHNYSLSELKSAKYWRDFIKQIALWLVAFVVSSVLILPSIGVNFGGVVDKVREFFGGDAFNLMHNMGPYYYLRTLVFFSTPVQLIGLILVMAMLVTTVYKKKYLNYLQHIALWLLSAIALVLIMSWSVKKGDRYILSAFLLMDLIAAAGAVWLLEIIKQYKKSIGPRTVVGLLLIAAIWQECMIVQLHPHVLAYVNPVTKQWFGERRAGWGEGLDLAAAYLNQKQDAANLVAASYYPHEFEAKFDGDTVSANRYDEAEVDYVVVYRAMMERGPDAWETDVLNYFQDKKPEKVISFNGVDFVWIYKTGVQ